MELLDRQLVHALHVDGRATFSRIGAVLGVSDQTVARHYRKLHSAGTARVVGRLEARRLGHVVWVVRLQCVPGASLAVARALASRPDTYWVRLASGGTEVVGYVQVHSERVRDALLLDKLPATRQVSAISAHRVLHVFRGGPTTWHGVTSVLTPQQIAALAPPAVDHVAQQAPLRLDDGDRALLDELARDGRSSHAALAAATHSHESTVRRRIAHLRTSGALYFDVDVDERRLGYTSKAVLWLSVEPSALATVGASLGRHPEVAFAAATTGPTNLLASVVCSDDYALYDYIAQRIGPLPGIRHIETAPVIRTVKRAGAEG